MIKIEKMYVWASVMKPQVRVVHVVSPVQSILLGSVYNFFWELLLVMKYWCLFQNNICPLENWEEGFWV